MASRQEIEQRRLAVYNALRSACTEGQLLPGDRLPPLRELATRYGASVKVAWQAIGQLVDEGYLNARERDGIFVGTRRGEVQAYLLTLPFPTKRMDFWRQVQIGFEDRIAQLGGASLVLDDGVASDSVARGQLPALAGVFRFDVAPYRPAWDLGGVPCVEFGDRHTYSSCSDLVQFDDEAGGRLAASHLLREGYRNIAFMAMHTAQRPPESFFWSVQREKGWAEATRVAGVSPEALTLFPAAPTSYKATDPPGYWDNEIQFALALDVARHQVLPRREISAVVAVNVIAAEALITALRKARRPQATWPAILCFDDSTWETQSLVSFLHLPWDDIGRSAAQLLWERSCNRLVGPPEQRLVPMRLVRRLSSSPELATSWGALRSEEKPECPGTTRLF